MKPNKKSLTVAVCIHKPELLAYTNRIKSDCKKFGYTFLLYKQFGTNNQSALVGRKRLIQKCKTSYIWLVDADDQILKLDFDLKHDIEMFYAKMSKENRLLDYGLEVPDPILFPPTWLRIVKTNIARKAIEKYPDFFAIDGEDTCLTYHIHKETKDVCIHPNYYYVYNTITSSISDMATLESVKRVFSKAKVYDYLPKRYLQIRSHWIFIRILSSPYWKQLYEDLSWIYECNIQIKQNTLFKQIQNKRYLQIRAKMFLDKIIETYPDHVSNGDINDID